MTRGKSVVAWSLYVYLVDLGSDVHHYRSKFHCALHCETRTVTSCVFVCVFLVRNLYCNILHTISTCTWCCLMGMNLQPLPNTWGTASTAAAAAHVVCYKKHFHNRTCMYMWSSMSTSIRGAPGHVSETIAGAGSVKLEVCIKSHSI